MPVFHGSVLISCVIFIGLLGENKNDSDLTTATVIEQAKYYNESSKLTRLQYNNPDLFVDLGVGLWAVPFPVDYTGNGQNDLLMITKFQISLLD